MNSNSRARSPVVSVCIPTYQGAQFIAQAIESVLKQTLRDFELIIVDDNSLDKTTEIVSRFNDPRIRFLANPHNLGPEGNWNRCLDEATGRYFKLLPQDDVLAPECLERQVASLESDTDHHIALVFCARNIVDAKDNILMVRGYPGASSGMIAGPDVIRRCLRWGTNLVGEPGCVLLRLPLARKIGKFDAEIPYLIDLDYWARLLLKGDALYLVEPLASFRVSTGSWSVAIGKRQGADFSRFMDKVARIPAFNASHADLFAGKVMARLNAYLRMIIYRLVLGRTSAT
jgi:glycosyltransferase involved in cell wall biosynthesis